MAKVSKEKEEQIKGKVSESKLKPNPDFNPKYKDDDDVKLEASEGAEHHKAGSQWTVKGHQATLLIKKGYAKQV